MDLTHTHNFSKVTKVMYVIDCILCKKKSKASRKRQRYCDDCKGKKE